MRCYNCKRSYVQPNGLCGFKTICELEDTVRRDKFRLFRFEVGKKIRFAGEKRYWTIIACNERFLICTRRTNQVYYTICDLKECIRGADNYYGAYEYERACPKDMLVALYRLGMEDSEPIAETELPSNIKDALIEEANIFGKVHTPTLDRLEISYKNWVPLDIEDVKE